MKKFLVSLFALVLVFTLAACATADEPFDEPQDDIPAITEESSLTDEEPSEEEELSEEEDTSPADEESSDSEETASLESSPTPSEDEPEDAETGSNDVPYDFNLTHGFVIDSNADAEALGLTIVRLDPNTSEEVTFAHMLDYDELRGSGGLEHTDSLMIRASVPLYDFAVVNITNDSMGDRIVFFVEDAFGFVESLLPGEAYVIISYVSVGTLPWSGISFFDGEGQFWAFAILQNQADEGDAYLLLPLVAYG